jgi:phosphoglycerate kinase
MKTLNDLNIDDKKVIIRCDLNVPIENHKITDNTRIIKSLKTINYCLERASKVIIMSHLGRIKTIEDKNDNSLRIVANELSKLLDQKVYFCTWEEDINKAIEDNKIVLLENTRFFDLDNKKESNCDEELSKYFASFGEVFINDAFGTAHRENASNVGISKYLESCNGFLIEEEINNLKKLDNPSKPFTVIMGGKKVSDKIKLIDKLITKVDYLLIGGAMVYTFLKADGKEIGSSFLEEDYLDYCRNLLNNYTDKIVLISDNFIELNKCISISDMSKNDIGFDIGIESVKRFVEVIDKSNSIFFNGSLGFVEGGYTYGTKNILEALNKCNKFVVIGGGDTVSACNELLSDNNFVISTGGGASLEYLQGNKLPGIIEE